jgi:NADH dehydrogenase (ubiquinone) 1 alpha/beta subcomplex 1
MSGVASFRPAMAPTAVWARAFSVGFLPKEEVQTRIMTVVKNFQNVDPAKVTATSHFTNDLGLDSLDTVEVVMAFEDEFAVEIPDAEAEKIHTIAAAVDYISSHPQAK